MSVPQRLPSPASPQPEIVRELRAFTWNGRATRRAVTSVGFARRRPIVVETFVNEFWTSKQRAAHSLHEVSYRACFKPQLPRFFIDRFTGPGDVVYDPFMGRGTTVLEAALAGRTPAGCDINPLSAMLAQPRLSPPTAEEVERRLAQIDLSLALSYPRELEVFYHPETLREICALREYLLARDSSGSLDGIDRWIRMVAVNRLTGHSPGFFSVYTLPPNQAVLPQDQLRINEKLNQKPAYRNTRALILRKSMQLQGQLSAADRWHLRAANATSVFLQNMASATPAIESGSVDLTVTSPPFLDVVQYARDNWLRCWFNGLDAEAIGQRTTMSRTLEEWGVEMSQVMAELYRITRRGGWLAFEVGEVRGGTVSLEETVAPIGVAAGFKCVAILINAQQFTKTANIWGVDNNRRGTNSNRIVLFEKRKS